MKLSQQYLYNNGCEILSLTRSGKHGLKADENKVAQGISRK